MTSVITYNPDSEDLENLTKGWVLANRINDIMARPSSKRYRHYLSFVGDAISDPYVVDPDDAWRHKAGLPRALDAYEKKHGTTVTRGRLYRHAGYKIAAAPDAVDDDWCGLTVHIRQSLVTFRDAIPLATAPATLRRVQAMMWVTGLEYWIVLDYFEDAATRTRKLYEHTHAPDPLIQEQVSEAMVNFYAKTRLRAQA